MIEDGNIQGSVEDQFQPVRKIFESLWNDIEVGAACSVYYKNRLVIELWGGHMDRSRQKPWQRDTLVNVYSTTKGIIAIAVACLVDDDLLDYTDTVSTYWPQFGAEDKFDITVAQLLSHQSGLYQFEPAVSPGDLYLWPERVAQLAAQKPSWAPGTAFGYHTLTWGYLVGELIHRVTGQTPGAYVRTRLAKPISEDLLIGLSNGDLSRCADVIGPNHARRQHQPKNLKIRQTLPTTDPLLKPFQDVCSKQWRQAEIPASNGHFTASSLAKCYDAVLSGTLLSFKTSNEAISEITHGETDLVTGQQLRRAMGFLLNSEDCYFGPTRSSFGHSGAGGSTAFADPVNQVSFAYTPNQLDRVGSRRSRRLIDSVYDCI
jgi:CubicO group peptidase (beta-lactamase class C family)